MPKETRCASRFEPRVDGNGGKLSVNDEAVPQEAVSCQYGVALHTTHSGLLVRWPMPKK